MNEEQGVPALSFAVRRDSYRGADSEDRAEIFRGTNSSILLVADGVGGRSGGAEAASLLQVLVQDVVPEITRLDAPAWARFLTQADLIIHEDTDSGETAAVIVQVSYDGRRIVGASVGDSEALFVTEEESHFWAPVGRKPRLSRSPFLRPAEHCLSQVTACSNMRPTRRFSKRYVFPL